MQRGGRRVYLMDPGCPFPIGWLIKNEGFERLPLSQQVNDIIMIDGIPNGPLYFFPNGHYWSYSDYYSIRYRLSL